MLCCTGEMHAQIYISTNFTRYGKFNYKTNEYDPSFRNNASPSILEFDKDFTILTHKIDTLTSIYLVKSINKDTTNRRWEFDIISDTGYSYYMIIDMMNENIRFLYRKRDFAYLTQLEIDKLWVDQ